MLILEDDICFNITPNDADSIDDFLTSNASWELYSLGSHVQCCQPWLFRKHVRVWSSLWASHAWIVSDKVLKSDDAFFARVHDLIRQHAKPHDHILSGQTVNFMYYKPVAFQTHPLTENAAFWAKSLNMTAIRLFRA